MGDSPATRPSLLLRIRDARDAPAWRQFEELYAPLIHGFGRKHGLQDADAADLTQEVLRLIARAVHNFDYDPRAGSFRGWLFTVVRNQHRKMLQRGPREQGSGDSRLQELLEEQPAPAEAEQADWDEEYQRRLFTYAAEQIRGDFQGTTWQAFWQTALLGRGANAVAADLGLTVAAVYLAKSRVMARLKEHIRMLQGD